MLLDLALAMSCGGAGVACGWVMHALGGFGNHKLLRRAANSIAKLTITDESNKERLVEIAHRLKACASSIAGEVEAYQAKVHELNNQLPKGEDASPDAVAAVITQLIETNQQIQSHLQQAQTQVHEQTVQVDTADHRAQADSLTRIPNRDAFNQHLARRFELGPSAAGSLALIEIDHLSTLNEVYGHQTGEEALKVIANVLHVRLESLGLVARYSSKEFAVILDNCRLDDAAQQIEAVRTAIGQRDIQFEAKRLWVSASMGVSELIPDESAEQWLQRTNEALDQSRAFGGDCGYVIKGNELTRITLLPEPQAITEPQAIPETSFDQNLDHGQLTADHVEDRERTEATGPHLTDPATPNGGIASRPGDFPCLPDIEMLGTEFEAIRDRTLAKTPIFVTAIRFTTPPTETKKRSMLHILRADMRCIDHLGSQGDSLLLLCMPSVDANTAHSRAERICRSASDVFGNPENRHSRLITVGVTPSGPQEEFCDVASRAIWLAEQCCEQKKSCIYGEAEQPAA